MNITDEMKREAAEASVGKTPAQRAKIAKRYGVHPQTLYVWRRKYIPEAVDEPDPDAGNTRLYSPGSSAHAAFVTKPNGKPSALDTLTDAHSAIAVHESIMAIKAALADMRRADAVAIVNYLRNWLMNSEQK